MAIRKEAEYGKISESGGYFFQRGVDVESFQNDMVRFADRDDVITLLIHLGYLGYIEKIESAYVPNEEIRLELLRAVKRTKWSELQTFEHESRQLLKATLDMNENEVARRIEDIHMEYASVIQYNDENSLSGVLTIGYLASMEYYFRPIREIPAGRGFADFVYLPKPEFQSEYPALLVELKWNKDAKTAINQIKEKKYPQAIQKYTGNILLAGISYNKKAKEPTCRIERFEKTE